MKTPKVPSSRELGRAFAIAQVGMEMVAPLVIGIGLDAYFGWTPWATVIGCVMGFAGGIVHLVLMANQPDPDEREPPNRTPR